MFGNQLTEAVARKVLETVDAGLVSGVGKPIPGQMCVEAAVCYAQGLRHGDNPACVGYAVRSFKIKLNDGNWPSPAARAAGLRRIAIAQLGSNEVNQEEFAKRLAITSVREILPIALRGVGLIKEAEACEKAMTLSEARLSTITAAEAASRTRPRPRTMAYSRACLTAASVWSAATSAAEALALVRAAEAAEAARSVAEVARSVADAAASAGVSTREKVLAAAAEVAVRILTELGCKGVQWLGLCS